MYQGSYYLNQIIYLQLCLIGFYFYDSKIISKGARSRLLPYRSLAAWGTQEHDLGALSFCSHSQHITCWVPNFSAFALLGSLKYLLGNSLEDARFLRNNGWPKPRYKLLIFEYSVYNE